LEIVKWYRKRCNELNLAPTNCLLLSAYPIVFFDKKELIGLDLKYLNKPPSLPDLKEVIQNLKLR
jgi:hypothetical protein